MSKKPPRKSKKGGSPKPPKITVEKNEPPPPKKLSSKKKTSASRPRKRTRWKPILVWTFLILAGLFVLLNGPGARYLGQRFFDQALIDAKIDGRGKIQGDVLNGLYLENLQLKNLGALKHLTAKRISLNYDLEDLKNKRIDSVQARGLKILLDLSPNPDKEPEAFTFDKLRIPPEALEQLDKHLTPLGIEVTQADLTIIHQESVYWHGENLSLRHLPENRSISLNIGSLTDLEGVTSKPAPSKIFYSKNGLAIEKLPLTHSAQASLQADLSPPSALSENEGESSSKPSEYTLVLNIDDSQFQLSTDDYQNLQLDFSGDPLSSSQLPPQLKLPTDLKFCLSELNGHISNLSLTPLEWMGHLQLKSTQLQIKERNLPCPLTFELKRNTLQRALLSADLSDESHPTSLHGTIDFSDPTKDPSFWKKGKAKLHLQGQSAKWILEELRLAAPKSLKGAPTVWPESAFAVNSTLTWNNSKILGAKGDGRFIGLQYDPSDRAVPTLLTYDWAPPQDDQPAHVVTASLHPLDEQVSTDNQLIAFKGYFNGSEKNYQLAVVADLEKKHFTHLAPLLDRHGLKDLPVSLLQAQFTSTGEMGEGGKNQGQVKITDSLIEHPSKKYPPTRINGLLRYDHEKNLTFEDVHLEQKNLHLHTHGSYAEDLLNLEKLTLTQSTPGTTEAPISLLTATARIPLSTTAKDLDSFIAQEGEIALYLEARQLPLLKLESLLQKPLPLSGILDTTLTVRGTLKEPTIRGDISIKELLLKDQKDIPLTDLTISIDGQNNVLKIDGLALPQDQPPITLNGQTTFRPWHWAKNPQDLQTEPLQLRARCQSLPLAPFTANLSAFREFDAETDIDLTVTGTIVQPNIQGQASLSIKKLLLDAEGIPPITNTNVQLDFDDSLVTLKPITINMLGGRYLSSGTIDLADLKNPRFDLSVTAEQALLWRNESFSSRANANARIRGTLEKSTISGNVDVIETLYYRAIEILPIGVATRTREAPKLPNFSRKDKRNTFPVPAPFDKWELDLTARTADPVLVRSNLATADINGSVRFTGTLGNPLANGTLTLDDSEATLPFSRLKIAKGKVRFTGKNLLNPLIEIRGTSRLNSYDVNLNINGPVNKTQTTLSTNPPLPEHEILALLATGVTTTGLEDQETASTKALQLLLERLRRNPPGGHGTALARFLAETRDVELRVAETSTFTGRKYSSASIPLHERWYVSAAMDEDKNTRGLIIYVLRFH